MNEEKKFKKISNLQNIQLIEYSRTKSIYIKLITGRSKLYKIQQFGFGGALNITII